MLEHDRAPVRVIVVDDDQVDRYLVRRVVESVDSNIELTEFDAGDRFVEVALDQHKRRDSLGETPPPVLVLLDINLPRMNGFEVLEQLESNLDPDEVAIIVMYSSSSNEDEKSHALKHEIVRDYIVKPLTEERFGELVDQYYRQAGDESAARE